MKARMLTILAFHFAVSAYAQPMPTPNIVTDSFLTGLRSEVGANYPSVRGAAERIAAAQAAVRTIRLWEDPMLGLGYMTGDEELMMDDGDIGF